MTKFDKVEWGEKPHYQMTYFLNGPMFNLLLFYHFLLYRKKRLLMSNLATILRLKSKLSGKFQHFNTTDRSIKIVKKIVEFSKISIKMKNCKTFCQVQTASHVKEIIQPPPPHLTPYQIKPYYVSGTNIFFKRYKEIYRHLLSKCFKNASRHGTVQIFFWFQTKICLLKICKVRKVSGCVEGAYRFQCQVIWGL